MADSIRALHVDDEEGVAALAAEHLECESDRLDETGDPHIYGDGRDAPDAYNPPLRSEFHVPLGEHGVLLAGSTEPDDFEFTGVELAR